LAGRKGQEGDEGGKEAQPAHGPIVALPAAGVYTLLCQPAMTMLIVETTAAEACPLGFAGDTAPLVYFMSFAAAERYGALHPLAQAASILRRQLRIDLSPLLRFTSAEPEGPQDVEELERLWQEAAPLARTCEEVARALREHPRLQDLTADFPTLADRLEELAAIACWAAQKGAKVRLTYLL